MDYTFTYDTETFELPAYTFDIQEKLDTISNIKDKKAQARKMYEFSCKITDNKAKDILGDKFEKVDPNQLFLFFTEIQFTYQSPTENKQLERITETIENSGIEKAARVLNGAVDLVEKTNALKNIQK